MSAFERLYCRRLTAWVRATRSLQFCVPCLPVACLADLKLLILLLFELRLIAKHADASLLEQTPGEPPLPEWASLCI